MARSTGPILAAAGITFFTDVIVLNRPLLGEARVVVAGAIAAGGLALLENVSEGLAVGIAWLTLATMLLVRINPRTPSPAEAFVTWYNEKYGGGRMSTVEKVALGIVAVALVTTAILPKRQTPQVINAFSNLFQGSLKTAMGR